MTILEFIKKLSVSAFSFGTTVLFQMPLVYIGIFLTRHDLIEKISTPILGSMDFWFVMSLCLTISVCYYLIVIGWCIFLIFALAKDIDISNPPVFIYYVAMFYSYVTLLISVAYYANHLPLVVSFSGMYGTWMALFLPYIAILVIYYSRSFSQWLITTLKKISQKV